MPPVQAALLDLLALVLAGRTFRRDVAPPHRQLLVQAITSGATGYLGYQPKTFKFQESQLIPPCRQLLVQAITSGAAQQWARKSHETLDVQAGGSAAPHAAGAGHQPGRAQVQQSSQGYTSPCPCCFLSDEQWICAGVWCCCTVRI